MATHGQYVPAGWYALQRSTGKSEKHLRLGLYCSLPCLVRSQRRLEEGASTHAVRLQLPADDIEHYADLLERALGDLHEGMTVREVGDKHGIPTKTLRGWLETASISIGADDRYSGIGTDTRQPPPLSAGQLRILRQGKNPISVVNELAQKQILHDIDWEDSRTGRAHKPLFTFSLTATRADNGSTLRSEGRSTTKAAARTAAAEDLVQQLTAALS
ncbi:hypothetical protein SAZ_34070 [Streptomyces noursei ZPM]|nr:hypothetical protein SAZ_34070 [Streptomyces noursei ZPM]EOT05807.1 hypothetical protein K530_01562 [Streptomyces noursei CCRC 11814]EXU92019.1 hypothetical protein P354_32560 [Streptomyces noursei PD-1]